MTAQSDSDNNNCNANHNCNCIETVMAAMATAAAVTAKTGTNNRENSRIGGLRDIVKKNSGEERSFWMLSNYRAPFTFPFSQKKKKKKQYYMAKTARQKQR